MRSVMDYRAVRFWREAAVGARLHQAMLGEKFHDSPMSCRPQGSRQQSALPKVVARRTEAVMQVSQSANSYTASSNGSSSLPNGNKQDQSFSKFVNDGNYASSNNALFKNMLSDPQLQDNYVLTADGAYEFIPDTTGTSYTDAVSILSFLIGEQNGDFDYEANGSVGLFTPNELATL